MPVVQLAHTLVCFSLNLAKLSDSQASCNECCFKLTEKVSSPIPKEQGNAMHLELIYIENLAASQNSMDSIATPGANLYIAGDRESRTHRQRQDRAGQPDRRVVRRVDGRAGAARQY